MKTTRFAGADGMVLAADVGGDPRRPPVILLHGAGQTRHSWGQAARELVHMGCHVIALDLRGHGESAWAADGDYSLDAFSGDLKAVIATLEQRPALVGASLGGATSLITIGESGAPLAGALVLVDVVPRMSVAGVNHIRAFMNGNPDGFADLAEAADAVARYLPGRPRPSSNDGLKKNLRLKDDGRLHWHWDPAFNTFHGQAHADAIAERLERSARRVTVPTLLVRGKKSDVVSEEGAQLLLRLIPHAKFFDVEGAGHMVAGDKNDLFNSAVEDFLQSSWAASSEAIS
nr:alpha/beta hydrolase [Massilia cavernae]